MKTEKKYRVVKLEKPYVGIPLGNDYAIQSSEDVDGLSNDKWDYFGVDNNRDKHIWAYKTFNDAVDFILERITSDVVIESEKINPNIRDNNDN